MTDDLVDGSARMKKTLMIVLAAAVAVGTGFAIMRRGGGGGDRAATASLLSGGDRALQAKLAPAVSCINRTLEHLQSSTTTYLAAVRSLSGNAAGGDGNSASGGNQPRFKIEPYEQANQFSTDCADGLDKAARMAPAIVDFDRAASDVARTLRSLIPVMNQADIYYDQQTFKDDGFKGGRAIDGALSPLLEQLADADHRLRLAVLREQAGLRERELAAVEASEGQTLNWHSMKIMLEARRLVDALTAAEASGTLTEPSVAAAIAPFQAAFDSVTNYVATHSEETRPDARGNRPVWFSIDTGTDSLLQETKALRRALAAHARNEDILYDIQSVGRSFNGLVQAYNQSIQFR